MLPYKYMSSHKQAQSNFIIVRIYIPTLWRCREKNATASRWHCVPILLCDVGVSRGGVSSAVLFPGCSLRSMIITMSFFGSFLHPYSYTGKLKVCWCLLLPNKYDNEYSLLLQMHNFIHLSIYFHLNIVWSRLEGHLCAQVCAADGMNIYTLGMNMVI